MAVHTCATVYPFVQVVQDATLGNLICGWLPTFRPKMLRTMKAPNYRNAACTHPGCRIKGCTGNVTYWEGDDLHFR